MTDTVRKWGRSLAIRVPKVIADQVQLKAGSKVEFDTSGGVLTILHPGQRRRRSKYKVSDLLAGYRGPYPHRDLNRDPPVGKELI